MPWKLAPDEETVTVAVKMPRSMKTWLEARAGGASRFIRALIAAAMKKSP